MPADAGRVFEKMIGLEQGADEATEDAEAETPPSLSQVAELLEKQAAEYEEKLKQQAAEAKEEQYALVLKLAHQLLVHDGLDT